MGRLRIAERTRRKRLRNWLKLSHFRQLGPAANMAAKIGDRACADYIYTRALPALPLSRNRSPKKVVDPPMAEPIIKTPTDERAGSKEGAVRYVLAISITLALAVFTCAYLFR